MSPGRLERSAPAIATPSTNPSSRAPPARTHGARRRHAGLCHPGRESGDIPMGRRCWPISCAARVTRPSSSPPRSGPHLLPGACRARGRSSKCREDGGALRQTYKDRLFSAIHERGSSCLSFHARCVGVTMNWVDYAILGVVLSVRAGRAWARPDPRGALLGVWIAAILVAWLFHREVAELLVPYLSQPSVRLACRLHRPDPRHAHGRCHLGAHPVGIDRSDRAHAVDRVLGLGFGAARGVVIVAMAVYLAA
jgi:membrane protein required for colicin V production